MDRTLSVQTPESIAFSYELAGLGSRFLAVIIDLLVQIAIFAAIIWGLALIAAGQPRAQILSAAGSKYAESIATAFVVALLFIVFFAYFIVFEAFWNGRTPGKRLMGLRVVRDGGYPLDFTSAAIRNLVRVGEVILGFYAISAIASVASAQNKRLGDMAAGTIVVRDSPAATLHALLADSQDGPRSSMLTDKEHAIIEQFVSRRNALAPAVRKELAARIAAQIRPRVSYDLQRLSDEDLLRSLAGNFSNAS
jgi:uncharacterized RDD family membrane protein YckC